MEFLVSGEWSRGSIETVYQVNRRRKWDARVERLIEEEWNQAQASVGDGRMLFAGPLCRLIRYEASGGGLKLFLGPTDYREYLGTSRHWRTIQEYVGAAELQEYLSNPLAVCAAVGTSDGKLVIGRRSGSVMEHAGYWHVPGGHVEPAHLVDGRVDVFRAMLDELFEELGVAENQVALRCLGLFRPVDTLKPELAFSAEVGYTAAELLALPRNDEHEELRLLNDDPGEVRAFLENPETRFVPSGRAALRLRALMP